MIEATGGGLLVQPHDPADLARALRHLLDNRTERTTLGQKGKEAVQARFNATAMAEQTAQLYGKFMP